MYETVIAALVPALTLGFLSATIYHFKRRARRAWLYLAATVGWLPLAVLILTLLPD